MYSLCIIIQIREYMWVYPGSGKESPTSSGGREYCISLHLNVCVGVQAPREKQSQVSKENENVEVLLVFVLPLGGALCLPFYRLKWRQRGTKKH
jgi:hypothetical protein